MSSSASVPSETSSASNKSAEAHQNEGFLRSAWHRLTHQHDNLTSDEKTSDTKASEKTEEEEPKKAAGSGQ